MNVQNVSLALLLICQNILFINNQTSIEVYKCIQQIIKNGIKLMKLIE